MTSGFDPAWKGGHEIVGAHDVRPAKILTLEAHGPRPVFAITTAGDVYMFYGNGLGGQALTHSQPVSPVTLRNAQPKPVERTGDAWGILNHLGDFWTSHTFDEHSEAQTYLDQQRAVWAGNGLDDHRVVPVEIHIKVSRHEG